jgi:hypothetical protein
MEPSAWRYNWATLFLRHINTGTWSSRLGEPRISESKIWSRVSRDSDLRMTALARASSNCMLHKDCNRKCQLENKITGRGTQGVRRKDELIGGKPPVVK